MTQSDKACDCSTDLHGCTSNFPKSNPYFARRPYKSNKISLVLANLGVSRRLNTQLKWFTPVARTDDNDPHLRFHVIAIAAAVCLQFYEKCIGLANVPRFFFSAPFFFTFTADRTQPTYWEIEARVLNSEAASERRDRVASVEITLIKTNNNGNFLSSYVLVGRRKDCH